MRCLYSPAILVLLLAASLVGETVSDPAPTAKKASSVAAAKRAKVRPPSTVSGRARTRTAEAASSSSVTRASTKRVIVTRRKVNGRWVRRTQIVRVPPAPSYQLHPESDRYQQIQQALSERGFYKGQANGEWNDDSVDALKRYQTASNLPNDGKINSLSLIGLGLGPKRNTGATPPPAQQ